MPVLYSGDADSISATGSIRICKYCNKEFIQGKATTGTYCNNKCQQAYQHGIRLNNYLTTGVGGWRLIRNYILLRDKYSCSICGLTHWNNEPARLVVDHIDGNSSNDHPDNLRSLCHNCDAQLPTYKACNKGSGRYYRRIRYENNQSY